MLSSLILSCCVLANIGLPLASIEDRIKKIKEIHQTLNKMARQKQLEYAQINHLITHAQEELKIIKTDPRYEGPSMVAQLELLEARLMVLDLRKEGMREARYALHKFFIELKRAKA